MVSEVYSDLIAIEVVYAALEGRQQLIRVEVPTQTTVEQAIMLSGILEQFAEIDLTQQAVGIFSERVNLSHPVQYGDRIEIYRLLRIDPKEARRKRG